MKFRISAVILLVITCLSSCISSPSLSIRNLGTKPPDWQESAFTKSGKILSSIWFSPDKKSFVQQVTRIHRQPTQSLSSMVSDVKSGHEIDGIRYLKIGGLNVADVRCRPLPETSQTAKFARFLIFEDDRFFDTILFSSNSKQDMNRPEFISMYRRLGLSNY